MCKAYPAACDLNLTYYPNSSSFTKSVDLYYPTPGTYTLKVVSQIATAYCDLISTPFNAGTRTVVVL